MSIVLKDIKYIDVLDGSVHEHKDILIEGERIVKIADTSSESVADEVITGDLLVIPGLINAHTHLGMTYFRNYADDMDLDTWLNKAIWPLEEHLTAEDIYWTSLLSLCEEIQSGTTTFCDMYFDMDRVGDAALKAGIRGVLGIGMSSFGDWKGKLEATRKLYDEYQNKGNGMIQVVPAPHAIYTCSADFLKNVFEMAGEMDGRIHIHISETKKEVEDALAKYGKTPVNYLLDLGMDKVDVIAAHCVHMTEEELDRVDPKKFFPVNNPTSNLKLASGFAPVEGMLKRGMKVALGTDGSSSNNNQDILEEMHIASILNKAVNEDPESVNALEVLQMATIHGAEALGLADEIGSIEEGKKADLAIFDLNSPSFTPRNNLVSALSYSAGRDDVKHVMVNGKFSLRDGKLVNVDLQEIMDRVNSGMRDLVKRSMEAKDE